MATSGRRQECLPGGAVSVALHGATGKSSVDLNVVQPSGFKTPFANLAATVTRSDFITGQGGVIGYAFVSDLQSQGKPLSGFLRENDRWQDSRLSGPARRELDFWAR